MPETTVFQRLLPTQLGVLMLEATPAGLSAIRWPEQAGYDSAPVHPTSPILDKAAQQLEAYLQGKRRSFDLPLAPEGTPYQQSVWSQLLEIPYGATTTYGVLAKQLGKPNGARAVGGATGKNPLSIVVPCHRVIGTTGKLTGFAGGLERKRWLLALEGASAA